MLFPMLAEACSFIVATPAGEFRGPEMLQKKSPVSYCMQSLRIVIVTSHAFI